MNDDVTRYCPGCVRLAIRLADAEIVLQKIAAPMRLDGSWNRDREACRSWHGEEWWELARPDELRAHRGGMARALGAALAVSGWEQEWRAATAVAASPVQASAEDARVIGGVLRGSIDGDWVESRLVGPWVRADDLQASPNESKDLESARASQDEPEAVPLPRPRPPRSHRDAESLRRWEARHPSVRFRPTVPLEQECVHVWRSSFGDTFCEKCNQDAPVEIAGEHNDL